MSKVTYFLFFVYILADSRTVMAILGKFLFFIIFLFDGPLLISIQRQPISVKGCSYVVD